MASLNGHLGVVLILLEHNADVSKMTVKVLVSILFTSLYCSLLKYGMSPLSASAHLEIAKVLLQHGASPTVYKEVLIAVTVFVTHNYANLNPELFYSFDVCN